MYGGDEEREREIVRDYYADVGLQLGHTIRKDTLGSSRAGASYRVHFFYLWEGKESFVSAFTAF